jgi:hypothetical protein
MGGKGDRGATSGKLCVEGKTEEGRLQWPMRYVRLMCWIECSWGCVCVFRTLFATGATFTCGSDLSIFLHHLFHCPIHLLRLSRLLLESHVGDRESCLTI